MRPFTDTWPLHFPIYLAEQEFFTRLLNDSVVRTENPWEANLFFIPTFTYYYIGNIGFPGQQFATVPEHDVAFPNYLPTEPWMRRLRLAYVYGNDSASSLSYGDPVRFNRSAPRDLLLSFDGFSKEDMVYSAGVRQGFLALFGNTTRPDVAINKGREPGADPATMLRSRFCFAPQGQGWGVRLSQAVISGCVPVLVHDHTYPLHRLLDMLDDITPAQVAALQDGLAAVHRAFFWQPEAGGRAYEHTLLSLHRRLTNMWTALFK
ncbi:hypothetical protein TSOC_008269 [Tetrabaena socialis]|uniref:Exostosin GT47 domain-containing protein n=1 Tax=Tetrabaena socialis TaxID=47790 RepID=A0A2J7ZYV3_9CHLO|nr:hypothetical protein TSOC_008269 [Tetrabaena socialis]|eukprot:PNH05450.1 hypothetical protein TSOC_008269 [Tetrabaena socialis]